MAISKLTPIFAILVLAAGICCGSSIKAIPDCKGVAFRAPGYILVGTAQGVLTAGSIDDCMALCASSRQRFNFYCLSGVFYYQAEKLNCILNSLTRRLRPDLFTADPDDNVEYFEIECAPQSIMKRQAGSNSRNRNVLQLQTPEFGNWTMCDKESMQHLRFKQCQTLNPNKCQQNSNQCEPSKEDEYDKENGSTGGGGSTDTPNSTDATPPAPTTVSITGGGTGTEPEPSNNVTTIFKNRRRPVNGTRISGKGPKEGRPPRNETVEASGSTRTGTRFQGSQNETKVIETFNGRTITSSKTRKSIKGKTNENRWAKNETTGFWQQEAAK